MIASALSYLAAGFSVVPIAQGTKRPLVEWKMYQTRQPTPAEAREWYAAHPGAGVAIVCGAVSGLVVVDFDPRNGDGDGLASLLPAGPTVATGGGGRHHYLRLPNGATVGKIPALLPGVDLQAESSLVIAPPSVHPNGVEYRWVDGLALGALPLPPIPPVLRDLIALHRRRGEPPCRPASCRGPRSPLTLEAALSRLAGVRRERAGWSALCPVHDDREQSLSVSAGTNGGLLAYCHAGCRFAEIVGALRAGVPA